jgi:pimeloyl-ACP methyl ester carboxylesterase
MTYKSRINRAVAIMSLALLWGPASAQAPVAAGAERWIVYGASSSYGRDAAVPGGDIVQIHIEKHTEPVKPWDSGAVLSLPFALHQGERVSVSFWARSERPVTVPITLHAAAAPYTSFAVKAIALTPSWQQFAIGGTAPSDLAANTQNLAVMLGAAPGDVFLGPALWTPGDASAAAPAPGGFEPASHVEDVRITSQPGVTLEGTLRTPPGNGPFPLVVCFSGSGPGPRGAFKLIDDRLIAEGIATFDYDKRGVGKSTGVFDDSFPLIQADAAAVVRVLRARPDIDDARIAVCGLSQGGVIGPLVAADDPQIAAVVTLSGPAGSNPTIFLDEMRGQLRAGGRSPASIDHIVDVVGQWMDARSAKQPAPRIATLRAAAVDAFATEGRSRETAEGAVAILDTPVLLSMYEVQPGAALARIKVPVLALYGEKDTVINHGQAMSDAKAALRNNPDATVIEIPGASHAFRYGGDALGYPFSIPQVLDVVTHWLVERLHPLKDGTGQ